MQKPADIVSAGFVRWTLHIKTETLSTMLEARA